jgi:hypothetical protein
VVFRPLNKKKEKDMPKHYKGKKGKARKKALKEHKKYMKKKKSGK